MHDTAFADSARPRPRRILRVRLRPYSLGHELILLQERNLMLLEPKAQNIFPRPARISGLLRAVSVCARTWRQNQRTDWWLWLWCWIIQGADFDEAIVTFRRYREEGSSYPRLTPLEGQEAELGREPGAPLMANVTEHALRIFGEAGYDQPLGMLQWMYFAAREQEGDCRVENAFDEKLRVEEEEIRAEYAREKALEQEQEQEQENPS